MNASNELQQPTEPDATGDPIALLVAVARSQGATEARIAAHEARLAAHEARLAQAEETAVRRVIELEASNADLRETLVLAGNVLAEIGRVCERHGWSKAAGPSALEWLEHVLSVGGPAGWPSVN